MTDDTPQKGSRQWHSQLLHALAQRDNAALLAMLSDDGVDAKWRDDRGQTLLHFAALRGDSELCDALLYAKKADILAQTDNGDTPARLAAIYGHKALAEELSVQERRARAALPAPAIKHFDDLRRERGALYAMACQGQFAAVVAAALRDRARFTAADLLAEGQRGESVLLRLCQSGQLDVLLQKDLWHDNLPVLAQCRAALPRVYRRLIDDSGLLPRLPALPSAGLSAPATPAGPPAPRNFKLGGKRP